MYQRYKFNNKWNVTGAWTSPSSIEVENCQKSCKNAPTFRNGSRGPLRKAVSKMRLELTLRSINFSFLTKLFTLFTEVRTLGSTYTHIWTREDDEIYTRQFKHWLRPWRRPKWKSPLAWRAADKINCSTTLTNTYLDLTATGADCDAANGLIRFAIVVA